MTDDFPSVEELRASEKRLVGDYIELDDGEFRCVKCGCGFRSPDENYKERLALRDRNVDDLGRLWIPLSMLVDDEMMFWEFYCPDRATRITTEVAGDGEAIVDDMVLDAR
ncbi:acetone carboxylase subunit gamma [Haladaptatus halobius]|uniref:acetone carboxylase subunit gamma n=1 Tax=Haladaptatus halobius TaxID=2884875 RepID=UPI001D099FC3|nr:acetone carboxylase subunit gamma [Haladaptatus halobius]